MTQEAFPLLAAFKINVASQVIRLKQEGHSYSYITKVMKQVAKKHVGKEKAYLLSEAKRLNKLEESEMAVA